jgi:hypothetical protein
MITSPFASLTLFSREGVTMRGVVPYARRSSAEIVLRLCAVVPSRNATSKPGELGVPELDRLANGWCPEIIPGR